MTSPQQQPGRQRALLLDLGIVLVHFDYRHALRRALPLCSPRWWWRPGRLLDEVRDDSARVAYERGEMTREEYFAHFCKVTGFRGTMQRFVALMRGIFALNKPMVQWAQEKAVQHPVYFFSNASDLHVPFLFSRFPELGFGRGCAVSYELRAMKPESTFFERGLAKFDLAAQECLFIDDLAENAEGARACGIDAVHYRTPTQAIAEAERVLRKALDSATVLHEEPRPSITHSHD